MLKICIIIYMHSHSKALCKAWRVLRAHGILLIIEPIYRKGTLGKIECLYHDERKTRDSAQSAVRAIINDKFILGFKKEIHIEDTCRGFEDLFKNSIQPKTYAKWDDSLKNEIVRILDKCAKTYNGETIMEYFATVWLLHKKI